ncbi:MAG: hypothetical protein ACOH2F_04160 [Cellulomonas sp.]
MGTVNNEPFPDPADLTGRRAVVAGLGTSGRAAAVALAARGAVVETVDASDPAADSADAAVFVAAGRLDLVDVVVASPGWAPSNPLLAAAVARGLPVWSEVELAWRFRAPRPGGAGPAPWLVVTASNGTSTCAGMLESMLRADGEHTLAVGGAGGPVLIAVGDPTLDVVVVELSSRQLHHTCTMSAQAAAVLHVTPESVDPRDSSAPDAADLGRAYERAHVACVYNSADPRTEQLVRDADVHDGALAVGFTLGTPSVGQVGLVEDVLVDRAFSELRHTHAIELGTLDDLAHLGTAETVDPRCGTVPPHLVRAALAAAALALAHGVAPSAVRAGLRAFAPGTAS